MYIYIRLHSDPELILSLTSIIIKASY